MTASTSSRKSVISEQQRSPRANWPQSGQTLFEMAMILPIMLALLLGVIEVGRYTYVAILVGNAARAGAEYGMQGHGNSSDGPGITLAAQNDFKSNGQNPATLTIAAPTAFGGNFDGCTCDNGSGAFVPAQPTTNYCTAPPNGTNVTAGTCPAGQHWVVLVSVHATGTFNSLFIPSGSTLFGIPGSITIDRTSTLRVAPLP
ncbi:MAG TPA: TadE/TadG family type IV pilus assembly protein [Candidatus Acidoferrum sp.]|jgi:Flp pilus assembly protein TadG